MSNILEKHMVHAHMFLSGLNQKQPIQHAGTLNYPASSENKLPFKVVMDWLFFFLNNALYSTSLLAEFGQI